VEELGGEILRLCVKVGGSISGEHGIGADKKCFMPDMFTEADLERCNGYAKSLIQRFSQSW
jgi:glycolate oxidase